ncbi:MAG: hypothetical protein KJ607_09655, partial [Bacteroidetes bacterium]|nr:hypothetical protein [Bacteroidota bacterium]
DAKELIKTAKLFKSNYSRYITGDQDMNATLTKLYNAYIGYGMEFYNKNDCAEAMINYRQAKNICSQNPGVTCTEELNTVTYDAHYCIYEQNLDEARRVLNTDPDKAEEIYNRAVAYQKMYEIKTSPEAGKLFASIKQAQYGLLISQGIERSEKNDYEGALVLFDKAKSWEGLYPVTPDTKLDKITRNTAVSLILSEAGLGEKEADKNRLEQARKHFSTARNLKNKYDLENDSKVSSAISDLKNKIFSRECKNAQAEYDRQFDLALEYIDKKEFINAENTLNEAIRFAEKNTECDISTISLEEKHTEILPGSVYQQLLSRTEELIGTKYYREAIEKYIEAGTYFSDRKVARLNLTHLPLQDYFIKTNSGFVLFGVRYYTNENQYSDALRLLGELRKRNFNPASTRENQELLGTKLAVKDHDENPGGDSKQTVLSHTQGDKWYKYLRKAYLKKWKKL